MTVEKWADSLADLKEDLTAAQRVHQKAKLTADPSVEQKAEKRAEKKVESLVVQRADRKVRRWDDLMGCQLGQ
jgi:hypothetical protein